MASFRYLLLNKSLSSSSSTGSEMTAPFSTTDITMASHSSGCKSKGQQALSQTSRVTKDLTIAPQVSTCSFHDSPDVDYGRDRTTDMEISTERVLETNNATIFSDSKENPSTSPDSSEITMTHVKRKSRRSGVQSEKLLSRREAWPDRGTGHDLEHESKSESKIEYFTSWIRNNPDEKLEERVIRRYAWQGDEVSTCHSLDLPLSGRQKKDFCDELNIEDLEDRLTLSCKKEAALTKINPQCEGSFLTKVNALESGQSFSGVKDFVTIHRNTVVLPPLLESSKMFENEDGKTPYFPKMTEPFTLDIKASESLDGIPERLPWPKKIDKSLHDRWRDVAKTLPSIKGTHKKRKIPRIPHGLNRYKPISILHLDPPESHGDDIGEYKDQKFYSNNCEDSEEMNNSSEEISRDAKSESLPKENGDDGHSSRTDRQITSTHEIGGINGEERNSLEISAFDYSENIPNNLGERFPLSGLFVCNESQKSDSKNIIMDQVLTASDTSKTSLAESLSHVSETLPISGTDEVDEICKDRCDDLSSFSRNCSLAEKQEWDPLDSFLDNIMRCDCINEESNEAGTSGLFRDYETPEFDRRLEAEPQCLNELLNNHEHYIRALEMLFPTDNKKYTNTATHSSGLKFDHDVQIVSENSNSLANTESPSNKCVTRTHKTCETNSVPNDTTLELQHNSSNYVLSHVVEYENVLMRSKNAENSEVNRENLTNNEHSQISPCASHCHALGDVDTVFLRKDNIGFTFVESKAFSTSFVSEQDESEEINEKSKNELILNSELCSEKALCCAQLSTTKEFIESLDFHTDPNYIHDVDNCAPSQPNCTPNNSKVDILENQIDIMQQADQVNEIVDESKNKLTVNVEIRCEETIGLAEEITSDISTETSDFHNLTHHHNIYELTVSTHNEPYNLHNNSKDNHLENEIPCIQQEDQGSLDNGAQCEPNCSHNNTKVDLLEKQINFTLQQDQSKETVDESKNEVLLKSKIYNERDISLEEGTEKEINTNSQDFQPCFIKEDENIFNTETDCECILKEPDKISKEGTTFMQQLYQRKEFVDESKSEPTIARKIKREKTFSLEETTLYNACKGYRQSPEEQKSNECSVTRRTAEFSDSKIIAKASSVSRKRAFSSTTMHSHNFKRSKMEMTTTKSFSSEQNICTSRNTDSYTQAKVKNVETDVLSTKNQAIEKEKLNSLSIFEAANSVAIEISERAVSELTSSSKNRDSHSVYNLQNIFEETFVNSQNREETTSHEDWNNLLENSVLSQLPEQIHQSDAVSQNSFCQRSGTKRTNSIPNENFGTSLTSEGNLGKESNGWETFESESVTLEAVNNVSEWLEKFQKVMPQEVSLRTNYSSGVQDSANQSSKMSEDPSSGGCTTTSRSTLSDSANEEGSHFTRDVVLFASSASMCERRQAMGSGGGGGGDDRVSSATRSDDRKRDAVLRDWRVEGRKKVLKHRRKKLAVRERSARCRRVLPPPLISAPPPSPRRRRHPVFSLPSTTPLFGRLATSSESMSSLRILDGSRKLSRRHFRKCLGRGDFLFKDPGSSENSFDNTRRFDENKILFGSGKENGWKTSGDSSESCHCACEIRKQNLLWPYNPHTSMLGVTPELTMLNELKSRRCIRSFARKRKSAQTASKSFSEFQTIKKNLAAHPKPLGAYFVPMSIIPPRGEWTRRSSPRLTPAASAARCCSSSKMHPDGNGGFVEHVEGHVMAPSLMPMEAVMPMTMALPQFVMPLPWQDTTTLPPSTYCPSPVPHARRTGPTVLHILCLQPVAGKQRK